MPTTVGSPSDRLAARWLSREGTDLPSPSTAAQQLLADRLGARRRANLVTASSAAIGTALLVPALSFSGDPQWRQEFYRRYLLLGIMIAVGLLLAQALVDRADRRIAAGLPHRVTRAERIGVRTVLGPAGTAQVLGSAGLGAGLAVVLLIDRHSSSTWIWLGWYLAATGATTARLWRVVNRPTVACDAGSLTIDERLRSLEALDSTRLLLTMWSSVPGLDLRSHSTPAFVIGMTGLMLTTVLHLNATSGRPWRRAPARAAAVPSGDHP
jgi:hypothetical protein